MTDESTTPSNVVEKPACAGPVYFADQGIEVCETCGGCICCEFDHVDHSRAEYLCFVGKDGRCSLRVHAGRECTKERT